MKSNKLLIAILLVFTFIGSFITGFIMVDKFVNKNLKDNKLVIDPINNSPTTAKASGDIESQQVISSKTLIKKITRYTKCDEYDDIINEAPTEEIIGMNEEAAKDYFKKNGYTYKDFNDNVLTVIKVIEDKWPPNVYIIKSDNDIVCTYMTDANSNLQFLEETDINLEVQTEDVNEKIHKGKVLKTKEELNEYIATIDS